MVRFLTQDNIIFKRLTWNNKKKDLNHRTRRNRVPLQTEINMNEFENDYKNVIKKP